MGLLDGKAAVVTGSGRGIGKGHALQLAKAGASVVVNDIDSDVAAEVVEEIEGFGGKAIANTDSVGEKSGADAIVAACDRRDRACGTGQRAAQHPAHQ